MIKFIRNYNKEDCIHFSWKQFPSCCGRTVKQGICGLTKNSRMCIQSASYCIYQRRKDDALKKD